MIDRSPYHDDLTGALNRRYLSEQIVGELTARIVGQRSFILTFIDIDRFKDINDTYGHLRGDKVIKEFFTFLEQSFRASDVIIRYGGDEFVCVMNDTLKNEAEAVLCRIAEACRRHQFDGLKVTLSAGIAAFPGDGGVYEEVIASADRALYEAKRAGRDRVSTVGERKAEIPIRAFIDRLKEKEAMRTIVAEGPRSLRAVVISGLVGIGKTRLSREILAGLKERDVVWTDCVRSDQPQSYRVIRDLVRYRLKRLGPDPFKSMPTPYLMEIEKLVPELTADAKDAGLVSDAMDRYRLYESIRLVLEMGSRDKVIVIDNIQWIDGESLEVLKYVIRALRESPITILLLHRTEEVSGALEDFLAFVSRDYETRYLTLVPFGLSETREAVRVAIGEEPPPDLTDYVLKESGGVPLYIEEIIRGLLDRNCLRMERDGWHFTAPVEVVLPGNVTEAALMNYRGLNREAQHVLDIAAILGWFDPVIIREITGFNEGHVTGLISEINRLGMIKQRGDRFEFSAAVNRHAIYQCSEQGERNLELHRKVADQLERFHLDGRGDYTADLAYHFYTIRECRKGAGYCRQAGDQARLTYANRDAIRYYDWAVELLGNDPARRRERLDIILQKVEVLILIGENPSAVEIVDGIGKEIAVFPDRDLETSWLILQMRIHSNQAHYAQAIEIGDRLLGRYEPACDFPRKAEALNIMGNLYIREGQIDSARTVLDEALKICVAEGDKVQEANVCRNLGTSYLHQGDNQGALEYYERSLRFYRGCSGLGGEALVLTNMGIAYNNLGQSEPAIESEKKASEIFRVVGDRLNETRALNNLAIYYRESGQLDKAKPLYERTLKNYQALGNHEGSGLVRLNIGYNCMLDDNMDAAQQIFEEVLKSAGEIKSKYLNFAAHHFLGLLYLETRQYDRIPEILNAIVRDADTSPDSGLLSNEYLCEYYLAIGDDRRFQDALDSLTAIAKSRDSVRNEAFCFLVRGRFGLKQGRFDQAFEDLGRGLDLFRRMRDRQQVARSYYYLAQVEKARGNDSSYRDFFRRAKQEMTEIKWRRWLKILAEEERSGQNDAKPVI